MCADVALYVMLVPGTRIVPEPTGELAGTAGSRPPLLHSRALGTAGAVAVTTQHNRLESSAGSKTDRHTGMVCAALSRPGCVHLPAFTPAGDVATAYTKRCSSVTSRMHLETMYPNWLLTTSNAALNIMLVRRRGMLWGQPCSTACSGIAARSYTGQATAGPARQLPAWQHGQHANPTPAATAAMHPTSLRDTAPPPCCL
jgi:hypothetical protein